MDPKHLFVPRGRLSEIARALGRNHSVLLRWRRVPAQHCQVVSEITKVPLHQLRPDIYPPPADAGQAAA